MRAARLFAAGDIRAEEIPAPAAPGPGEVLLVVEAAGICGSDLHNFRTGQWISRAPSVAGHELAGRVIAVGAGVEGFVPGDHVVCAVSGARIGLEDLRYWDVGRQEAYATAQIASEVMAPQ